MLFFWKEKEKVVQLDTKPEIAAKETKVESSGTAG